MKILERYSIPTRYTYEEANTIWKAILPGDIKVTFINVGDNDNPHWIHMGEFFEAIYKSKYNDSSIMEPLIHLYHKTKDTHGK